MENAITKFDDIQIEKQNFYQHKRPISIKNVEINKIVVCNKVSFCKKSFKYSLATKMLKNSPL